MFKLVLYKKLSKIKHHRKNYLVHPVRLNLIKLFFNNYAFLITMLINVVHLEQIITTLINTYEQ